MNLSRALAATIFLLTLQLPLCAQEAMAPAHMQAQAQSKCAADLELTVEELIERFNKNSKQNHFKVKMKSPVVVNTYNCNPDFIYYNLQVSEGVGAVATVSKTGDKHINSIIVDYRPKFGSSNDSEHFNKNYTDLVATLFQTLDGDSAQDPQTYLAKIRMHPSLVMPDGKSPDYFVVKHWIRATYWNSNSNVHCQARICNLPPFVNHALDFEMENGNTAGAANNRGFPQCGRELDFGITVPQLEHRFDTLCAQQGYPLILQNDTSLTEMMQNNLMSPRYPVVPGIIASAGGRLAVPGECGHLNGFSVDTHPPQKQGGAIYKIDNRRYLQIASAMLESVCPEFGPKDKAEIFSRLQMTQFANLNNPLPDNVEQRIIVGDIHFYFGANLKPDGRYLQFHATRIKANPVVGE